MKIDVSEIKTFSYCKRQWELSSRNRMHLTAMVAPAPFAFGTLFHESLAQLYLGVSLEKVMAMVRKEMSADTDVALLAMIPGYYENVLGADLDRFKVLDIEHHFEIPPITSNGEYLFPLQPKMVKNEFNDLVQDYDASGNPIMESSLLICGSIDMVVLDKDENKIYGFEHKTCKSFRDETYLWMDEQPRVYTWALQYYVRCYNDKQHTKWLQSGAVEPEPVPVTLGGVYMNEVKKLLKQFQYQRTLCTYSDEDLDNFMQAFYSKCTQCKHMVDSHDIVLPQPTYFGCQSCMFKTICSTYMYSPISLDTVLNEFKEEFKVRAEDHLEEKAERSTDDTARV